MANRGLGEPSVRAIRRNAWESRPAVHQRGEPPMENALLIGLSRQMVLERQMDVVANNLANVNTNGFKTDASLFQEYLKTGAHEDNFVGGDRAVSYVQDRGTYRDFTQGALSADQQSARSRDRRRRLPRGADARRRALHPRRRPAAQQPGPAGDGRRRSRARRQRPDRVPADRPRHQRFARRHRHRAGRQRPDRRDPRQASPRQLRQRAAAAEGRLQPLFRRRRRRARSPTSNPRSARASSRSPTSTRWRR